MKADLENLKEQVKSGLSSYQKKNQKEIDDLKKSLLKLNNKSVANKSSLSQKRKINSSLSSQNSPGRNKNNNTLVVIPAGLILLLSIVVALIF